MLDSSNSCFHPILSYGNSPQWLPCPFLLRFAFRFTIAILFHLVSTTRGSWAPLIYALWIVAKLLCSLSCLLDAIVALHALDGKRRRCSMTFYYWKVKVDFMWNKCFFDLGSTFCICSGGWVEAFITLHWKA